MKSEMNKPKFKRTQYLVFKKFQLKYVGLILLLMFATALVCSYVVYYAGMMILADRLANVYPQGRLMSIINAVNLRILISMLFLTPVVAFIGIYLSHKIAGPIYRMEKFLGDLAAGNLTSRIVLRKGDELLTVADKINFLADSLRATVGNQKTSLIKILAELDSLKKMADSRPRDVSMIDANIDRLHKEIQELAKELDRYKI